MPVLIVDDETRSVLDLRKVGMHRYAADPSTQVLCVGYAVDDEPVQLWLPGQPVPEAFKCASVNRGWTIVAHNAAFERCIERGVLHPRHDFPIIPLERWRCLMATSMALALPAKLENVGKALGLEHQKDIAGNRTMLQVSKPRKANKGEDSNGTHWFDDDERMQRLYEYCRQDVETERELFGMLPLLSDNEQALWIIDQHINERGFCVDAGLAEGARRIIASAAPYLDEQLTKVTDGAVTSVNKMSALSAWLAENGCFTESLDKASIGEVLERDLPDNVRRAVELRFLGAQAAAKKIKSLQEHVSDDGRIRGAFTYHASSTGRWASRGTNVQNLKRQPFENEKDLQRALVMIRNGDFDYARKAYDNPLKVIGDCIRSMICAAPGKKFVSADYSGVEARVTAWIADETSKLEAFQRFDESGKFADNPYVIAAARIFHKPAEDIVRDSLEYRGGKAAELALGFGGGARAYEKFVPEGLFTESQVANIVEGWRAAHPNICRYWDSIKRAVWAAVKKPDASFKCGRIILMHDGQFLWLTLPSGRKLAYPHCRIENVTRRDGGRVVFGLPSGFPGVVFKDNAAGQWRDVTTWHGLWVENIVQAIARDLLAEAIVRVEAAGLPVVVHVHDSITVEVPVDKLVLKKFTNLVTQVPAWAEGLPIATKAEEGSRLN